MGGRIERDGEVVEASSLIITTKKEEKEGRKKIDLA